MQVLVSVTKKKSWLDNCLKHIRAYHEFMSHKPGIKKHGKLGRIIPTSITKLAWSLIFMIYLKTV